MKEKLILVLIFFGSSVSYAREFSAMDQSQKLFNCFKIPSISQMEKDLKLMYDNNNPTPVTISGAFTYLAKKITLLESFDLDGFKLKNSSFWAVQDLHTLTYRTPFYSFEENTISKEDITSKGKKRPVSDTDTKNGRTYDLTEFQKKDPNCHDVICAVKSIFGNERGIKILWLYKKYGLNLSRYQFVHGQNFNSSDLDAFIKAMMMMPEHLHPFIANGMGFFRFSRGYTMGRYSDLQDAEVVANAFGAIFDPIDNYGVAGRMYIFAHEMGHRSADIKKVKENDDKFPRSLDDTSDWHKTAGWSHTGKKSGDLPEQEVDEFKDNRSALAVSRYAQAHPREDFAETFAAYRFAPSRLLESSPERYAFMRDNVFQQIEYREDLCSGSIPSKRAKPANSSGGTR